MHFRGRLSKRRDRVEPRSRSVTLSVATFLLLILGLSINQANAAPPPTNTVPPKITGTYSIGSTLTGDDGTWADATSATTVRQWQSSTNGTTWSDISGATSSSYLLTSSEAGKYIRFKVSKNTTDASASAFNLALSGTKLTASTLFSSATIKYRNSSGTETSVTSSTDYSWSGTCNGGPGNIGIRQGETLIVNLNTPRSDLIVNLFGDNVAQEFKIVFDDATSITYTQSSPIFAKPPPENTQANLNFPVASAQHHGGNVDVPVSAPAGKKISGFEIKWTSDTWSGCSGIFGFANSTFGQLPAVAAGAPTALSATAGNASAIISFTDPSSNGGANISNYKYSTDGSTYTALNPADATSPITIPGLTNGTTYSITLKAVNSAGDSTASTAVSVTPFGAPGTPDLDAASDLGTSNTDNNTSDDTPTFSLSSLVANASVTLTATRSGGGSATCSFTSTGSSGSCTFTSLPNGTYSLSAQQSLAGVTSAASSSLTGVVINKATIDTPSVPDLADASDSGISNTDNITRFTTLTISVSGTFTGTRIIRATKAGSSDVTCTVSSGSCSLGTLTEGVWNVTVTNRDTPGNEATSSALSITVDTSRPTLTYVGKSNCSKSPSAICALLQSSEIGTAYLEYGYRAASTGDTFNLSDGSAVSTMVLTANTTLELSASGLSHTDQNHRLYVEDIAGNLSFQDDGFGKPGSASAPGTPTSVSASITGSTTATVSFSAPAANGGSAITGYTVTSTPSGAVCAVGGNSTTYNCTGLTANTAYTFKVKATNTVGTGTDSVASSSQTTEAVNRPISANVSVASRSLTASLPISTLVPITASGGAGPRTYSISPSLPSGLSLNTSTGAITGTPTGASASTSYTVSVTDGSSTSTATFSLGVNAALSSSAGTVPSGVYKDVAVTAFTPVSFSGGTSPVTYSVSPSLPVGLSLNTSTGVISGTATGTAASTTYTVTATDANGASKASTFAFAVTNQPTAPGAPTIGAATSTGQTTATVAFTAPASTGGAAITTYTVTASPGSITATGSSSPITVTGLTAGTAYTFSITATNAAGLTSSSSSPSSSITTESAPVQNNSNGGGGGGSGGGGSPTPAPAPEPAPEPVCNAACVAAQNAAAKAAADKAAAEKAAAEKLVADKAAAEKAAAEKLVADKAAAVAVAEKTKVDVSAALAAATAAAEKVSAATVAKLAVDTIAAAVSTLVNSANTAQTSTSKITNDAITVIKSAPTAATKAASTASANSKANTAATQVKTAATAAQKAAASSQTQTSDTPEIAFGSSSTASAASQAAAKADAAARAGKAAANEVAAAAEAKSIESKATATALQNEANAAVAEAIAEQKVASALATEAKAAADKASAATAEKIAATVAAKTAAETLVTLLTEKVAIAEKVATVTSEEVRAEAQKSLDTVNIEIAETERAVTETVSKADAAIAAQAEAIKVAEATKATAEAQVTKVDQLLVSIPTKATAAVRAATAAAVAAKVATAAKAAAAKVPSKALITKQPSTTSKNGATVTVTGLKPGQKVKVTVNVKPNP